MEYNRKGRGCKYIVPCEILCFFYFKIFNTNLDVFSVICLAGVNNLHLLMTIIFSSSNFKTVFPNVFHSQIYKKRIKKVIKGMVLKKYENSEIKNESC